MPVRNDGKYGGASNVSVRARPLRGPFTTESTEDIEKHLKRQKLTADGTDIADDRNPETAENDDRTLLIRFIRVIRDSTAVFGFPDHAAGSSERHRYQLAAERWGCQRFEWRRIASGFTERPRR
jgi:hypothetical protein